MSRQKGRAMPSRARVISTVVALVTIVVTILLAGCGSSATTSSANGSGSPKSGGSITIVAQSEPVGLNPFENWLTSECGVIFQIFGQPFEEHYTPAQGFHMVPGIAEALPTFTNGGKTMIFQIRKGVKFQPPINRQVTAEDVKWSLEYNLRDPRNPGTFYYAGIVGFDAFMAHKTQHLAGIKALDSRTVEVDFSKANLASSFNFAIEPASVVPKEWVEKWGPNQIGQHPLGTGPYMLQSWTKGQQIVLVKNPNYLGKTYLDKITIKYNITPSTQIMMVKSGEADVMWDNIPAADMPALQTDPKWKGQIAKEPGVQEFYMFLNTTMKPLNNVDVRQAIAWAIDRDKLVKLLGGMAVPSTQFAPQGMNIFEPNAKYCGYDPAKAKQLLAAAGYPNGFSTALWTYSDDPWPTLFQSIQNDLAAVGIKANLKMMSSAQLTYLRMKAGKTPAGAWDWYMDFPDPFDWFEYPVSKQGLNASGYDAAFFDNPKIDAALASAQSEMNPATRIAKFRTVQKMVMAAMPYVPLAQPTITQLVNPRLGGYFADAFRQWSMQDYWVK